MTDQQSTADITDLKRDEFLTGAVVPQVTVAGILSCAKQFVVASDQLPTIIDDIQAVVRFMGRAEPMVAADDDSELE